MGIRLATGGARLVRDLRARRNRSAASGAPTPTPGAACDVPSHLYSFSFAPGHRWSRRYAPAGRDPRLPRGVLDRLRDRPAPAPRRRGRRAPASTPPRAAGRCGTEDGERREFDLLVTACGQLTRPAIPPLAGIEEFDGPAFHSAEWDHDVDLTGKRVAVIGTGASAIQFVPEVAEIAASTTIYQRSAPWILPKLDRSYPAWEQALFRRFPPGSPRAAPGFLRLLRDGDVRLHRAPLGLGTGQANRRLGAPPDARPRPRAAREDDPGLRDRLQAGPVHERLVPDPASRRRRAVQRAASSRSPRAASSAPTGSSARRT